MQVNAPNLPRRYVQGGVWSTVKSELGEGASRNERRRRGALEKGRRSLLYVRLVLLVGCKTGSNLRVTLRTRSGRTWTGGRGANAFVGFVH